jgi:hypothetical protein
MPGLTVGLTGAPNVLTTNLDVILTLAFANAGGTIFDAISKSNAVFHEIKKNGMYEGVSEPEKYLEIALMYGLGKAEWYEAWDVLNTQPTEGVTAALYNWRSLATPQGYNDEEARMTNPKKIKDLAKLKVEQAQMTMTEEFNNAWLQGAVNLPGGNLYTEVSSVSTGRSGITPLPRLVYYQSGVAGNRPTDALEVGGLDQATKAWWRNWSMTSAAATYEALLLEFDKMYDSVSTGAGGPPTLIITDMCTRRLLNAAYYKKFQTSLKEDANYPFDNVKFRGAHIVCDEQVPDVETGVGNTDTYGTAYFLSPKFIKIKYDSQANFVLTDLQKPVNQMGKIGHVYWRGNSVVSNRRKHGVLGKIARSLT